MIEVTMQTVFGLIFSALLTFSFFGTLLLMDSWARRNDKKVAKKS